MAQLVEQSHLRFESSHRQILFTIECIEKRKMKEKEAVNGTKNKFLNTG